MKAEKGDYVRKRRERSGVVRKKCCCGKAKSFFDSRPEKSDGKPSTLAAYYRAKRRS